MLIPGAFPQVPRPQHNPPRTWPYPVPAAIQNTATSNLLHQANNNTTKLSSKEECEWFDVPTFRCTETEPMTGSMRRSGNWWQWLEPHHPIFSGSLSWLSTLDFYSLQNPGIPQGPRCGLNVSWSCLGMIHKRLFSIGLMDDLVQDEELDLNFLMSQAIKTITDWIIILN